jgi:fumarate reductase flavoprotein subunit
MSSSAATDYDVIIVGAGGAGLAAAICAADTGARVAVLEAWDRIGGSTALAGGYVYAVDTHQQHDKRVDDSRERMQADIRDINGDTIAPAILGTFAAQSAETVSWLGHMGVEFPVEKLVSPDGLMPARAHEPVGYGYGIVQRLEYAVSQRGIDIALNTRVETLATNDDGNVCGIVLDGAVVSAGAVILACGGIGADPDLLDRYCPKSKLAGGWRWYVGCQTNRGDGLRMAQSVSAEIAGLDSGLFLMTPNFYRDLEVIGPGWVALVNHRGERIAREDGAYWEISQALEAQEDGRGYAIFSHDLMLASEPDPRVLEALANGGITLNWSPDVLQEQIETGRVVAAASVAELAQRLGIETGGLERTLARYNSMAAAGSDEDFGKSPAALKAVNGPPYYAVEVRPAVAIVTGAGPAIDERARVVRPDGTPIAGLYAAGETVGNVYGRYYVGSGYAIGSAITFGRIAGREAARFARPDA